MDKTEPFLSKSGERTMSDTFERTASQYERKLARQRQLEQMEAAATGTAPSMELDTSVLSEASSASSASVLRSRSDAARRFLQDEDEGLAPSSPIKSSNIQSKNLFDVRGRPDGLPVNTGLNLMDHETAIYKEQTRTERMMNRVKGMFTAKTGTEAFDADDAVTDDYLDYNRPLRRRQGAIAILCRSLWIDRRRRVFLLGLVAVAIFFVLATVTTVRIVHPSEKVLRQQNNARFNSVMDSVVAQGVSSQQKFLDYTSPEYHALRWVAYSDPAKLDLDDPMITTRYALAVFFYNSFLKFEKTAGRQKPIEIGETQWEGVPNPGWTRKDYWLTEKGVCFWYGVHCTPKRVTNDETGEQKLITQYNSNEAPIGIQIHKNHISGGLVSEFKVLDHLKLLDLSSNKITGTLPSAFGHISSLETVRLPENNLSGSVPSEFGKISGLKTFDLRYNSITGELPSELKRLYKLENLLLSHNQLRGKLPDLTEAGNLTIVHLDRNKLDSFFPFSLALLTSLKEMHINNNLIYGTIPAEVESIRNLESFRVNHNELTGSIPFGMFGRMSHLRNVAIENNRIDGFIPSDTSAMVQLESFTASNNMLTGTIAPSWGMVQSLTKFIVNENKLSGSIPTEMGNLTSVKELWFDLNQLSGQVPDELIRCHQLESLHLDGNKFGGSVPSGLGSLEHLKTLKMHNNNIQGEMPDEICHAKESDSLSFISADCKTTALHKSKVGCHRVHHSCCDECH